VVFFSAFELFFVAGVDFLAAGFLAVEAADFFAGDFLAGVFSAESASASAVSVFSRSGAWPMAISLRRLRVS
jgi:hypothetical protein